MTESCSQQRPGCLEVATIVDPITGLPVCVYCHGATPGGRETQRGTATAAAEPATNTAGGPAWCSQRRPRVCGGVATQTDPVTGAPICDGCLRMAGGPTPRPPGQRWGKRGVPKPVRQAVLDRDAHRCQLGYPGVCIGTATEADHTVSTASQGVDRDQSVDPADMRAVCVPCHRLKTRREISAATAQSNRRRARRRRQPPQPHPGD